MSHSQQSSNRLGFTFVEIFIALLILGILAAIAVPKYSHWLRLRRLESAKTILMEDLKYASTWARTKGTSLTIHFDVSTDSYTLQGVEDPSRPGINRQVDLSADPFQVDLTQATLSLTFDKFGNASTAGQWELKVEGLPAGIVAIEQSKSTPVEDE